MLIASGSIYSQYWEKQTNIPTGYDTNYWLDVYFLPGNINYGWICGFDGKVVRTTDGGTTWSGSTVSGAYHLESINFPSPSTGYTSGVEGIWKSTNGGASWFNVTPVRTSPPSPNFWGCFFVDDNNGMVVGEGCGNNQYFYKTTDGGGSWSIFSGNEPNSGMTDVILYNPNGLGYAVSSGKLWQTTDGGATWNVFATSGTNLWQEEITKYNNSFLLPYAGDNCSGGGTNGGMRFTIDNGISWNQYSTGQPMFGSFLINETEGWACGYNEAVYHTTNAGLTWVLKNCGIKTGNLDDMYFTDANHGWVVGQGVYKLAPAKQDLSKNTMNFKETCLRYPRYDTLYVRNMNFIGTSGSYTLTGPDFADFTVLQPSPNFTLQSCDSEKVVVKFNPSTAGIKNAILTITIIGIGDFPVTLSGNSVRPSGSPKDTLVVVNPVRCGTTQNSIVNWKADNNNEWIMNMTRTGSQDVSMFTGMPINLSPTGIDVQFTITPTDTGWITTRFKFRMFPCDIDTFITFRVYGIAPIITAQQKYDFALECVLYKDFEVPIFNTGNDDLIISSIQFTNSGAGFSSQGWKSKRNNPNTIKPKESDTLLVRFFPFKPGTYTTKLRLFNNDETKTRGPKNPFDIDLTGTVIYSNITTKDTVIDLGEVCLYDSSSKQVKLYNSGSLSGNIDPSKLIKYPFALETPQKIYPVPIRGGDTLKANITFKPKNTGKFSDTIVVAASPCGEIMRIAVKGVCIKADVSLAPTTITGSYKINKSYSVNEKITNNGSIPVKITGFSLVPQNTLWDVTFNPPLPYDLNAGESKDIEITFQSNADTSLISKIIFTTESKCPVNLSLQLSLSTLVDKISMTPASIAWDTIKCTIKEYKDIITARNEGNEIIKVLNISVNPAGTPFSVKAPKAIPFDLNPDDSTKFEVTFNPIAIGTYTADVIIELSDKKGIYTVPVSGSFYKSVILEKDASIDFGDVKYCKDTMYSGYFVNIGNLTDTLKIKPLLNTKAYTISPADQMVCLPNDTVRFTIKFDATLCNSLGKYDEQYQFTGTACNESFKLPVTANVIRPKLTVAPSELTFNNIWVGDSSEATVKITNSHNIRYDYTGYEIHQAVQQFTLNGFKRSIGENSEDILTLKFKSLRSGNWQDTLIITYENECPDTLYIILKSNNPKEEYLVDLSIGDYKEIPGDTITIALKLNNPVYKFRPDSIDITLSWDSWLFYPSIAYIMSGLNVIEIPFTFNSETFRARIAKQYADTLLKNAGNLLYIKGLTYISSPNETPLKIDDFKIYSDKSYLLTRDDGTLLIEPVCHPTGAMHLQFIPTLSIGLQSQFADGNLIELDYQSNGEMYFYFNISDIAGNTIKTGIAKIENGNSKLLVDVNSMTSGTYAISCISTGGHLFKDKFIIIR